MESLKSWFISDYCKAIFIKEFEGKVFIQNKREYNEEKKYDTKQLDQSIRKACSSCKIDPKCYI